ncbi:oligosaccharide flippase family protein [Bacillus paranthracis]|uniref:oligosaccharide flippase family protein n=1 Tax=Bacillus paranthracis TaxID=2026186 RepID=UPI0021D25EE8|nr:oligosaccharide flippase family protein [Bacillus paranthracis]MCU5174418.1 oligosaccharide flippase family protein [Bacillus paranthracis]
MSKIISNYLFTVMYQILLLLTPFITTPYVSRILKAEGIGIEAYVSSIVQIFIVFIVLSIPLYGSRQIATKSNIEDRSNEFWSIFSVQIIFSIFNIIIYYIFMETIVTEYKALFLINIFTIIAYSIDVSWYFMGKEEMKKIAIRNMLVKITGIILTFTLIKDYSDLDLYVFINGFTLFMGQLIMWGPLLREISFKKVSYSNIKIHFIPMLTLFIPQLMIQIYVLLNKIVLGNTSGEIEVGYYNQANKIVRLALGVVTSIGTVLLPRMAAEFVKGNRKKMETYVNYTMRFILMITLPMTCGLMVIAPNFVSWFLGSDFLPVIELVVIMSPVILFVGLANVFGIQVLIATNQQKKYSIAVTVGAIFSLIINFILVYSLGSIATTISLVVAEATGALICMYYAKHYFNMKQFFKLFFKYLILAALAMFVVKLVGDFIEVSMIIITIIQIIVGGLLYLGGLIITKDRMVVRFIDILNNKFKMKGNLR